MRKPLLMAALCVLFAGCYTGKSSYDSDSTNTSYTNDNHEQDADWQITMRVKSTIMSDGELSSSGRFISVETNNGIVTLTGNVRSKDESRYIERKVKSISGVRKVVNHLTINPQ